ncbi:hypothetical protein [Paraeggerthella hongkongensis]|uniref:Uncharacterized protein n=1 Tax=Paraeggerthella hongkongensis TaxID=230658 RepID=A0A3N0BKK9_9ACTN|nr:hypothetical protein [Paraeggerthella hongkongensis]RNL48974.1 hypothetical protein DMP08_00485 [Paraeggerthella hongkongensis]
MSNNSLFALLGHVGFECPGAVRFCADEAGEKTRSASRVSAMFVDLGDCDGAGELRRRLAKPVEELCSKTLAKL